MDDHKCNKCGENAEWLVIETDGLLDLELHLCNKCYWPITLNITRENYRIQSFNLNYEIPT